MAWPGQVGGLRVTSGVRVMSTTSLTGTATISRSSGSLVLKVQGRKVGVGLVGTLGRAMFLVQPMRLRVTVCNYKRVRHLIKPTIGNP